MDAGIFIGLIIIIGYLYALAWRFWLMAIQTESQAKLDWIMLEVRLPRMIDKSPKAFEIAANAFLQGGGISNRFSIFWKGNMPIYFNLEIVSFEGDVHFYIRTQKKFKDLITNNIYSQYPTVEIMEVPDYMPIFRMTHHTSSDNFSIWGINYGLGKDIELSNKEPNKDKTSAIAKLFKKVFSFKFIHYIFYGVFIDIYDSVSNLFKEHDDHKDAASASSDKHSIKGHHLMINTYIDYGMDKDPKEIFKHDPLSSVLEWLGSLQKGQYGIYQVSISDEANFKSSSHSLGGPKGKDKWPALYENPIESEEDRKKLGLTSDMLKLADLAKFRMKQIRTSPKVIKHKKGDKVYDNEGYVKQNLVDTGEKDEDGKPKMKKVDMVYGRDIEVGGDPIKDNDLNTEQKLELELIARKLSKPTFAATVRSAYIKMNAPSTSKADGVQSTLGLLKQYGRADLGYNFAPGPATGDGVYDYGWQDSFGKKKPWRDEEFFESLVERECFFSHGGFDAEKDTSWDVFFWNKTLGQKKMWRMIYDSILHPFTHAKADNIMVINTEELASLYHFPGEVASTPGLKRIDSVKSDAPNNLPI